MKTRHPYGFSLVEILVSLFIVSLAAVNISGLQKMVGEQTRDNFSHSIVIQLASEKLEEVMQYEQLQHLLALNGSTASFHSQGTDFYFNWSVKNIVGAPHSSSIRSVSITVNWLDSTETLQTYTYSKYISLQMLHDKVAGNSFEQTIPNLLDSDKATYFEPKIGYKIDAYVIYNSQLFQATEVHDVGNGSLRTIPPPINQQGVLSDGWDKLGRIDNKALARLFID